MFVCAFKTILTSLVVVDDAWLPAERSASDESLLSLDLDLDFLYKT
jgi:hypothetical protein